MENLLNYETVSYLNKLCLFLLKNISGPFFLGRIFAEILWRKYILNVEGLFKDCSIVHSDCSFDNKLKCDGNRNRVQEGIMYNLDGTSEYGRWETNTYFTNN